MAVGQGRQQDLEFGLGVGTASLGRGHQRSAAVEGGFHGGLDARAVGGGPQLHEVEPHQGPTVQIVQKGSGQAEGIGARSLAADQEDLGHEVGEVRRIDGRAQGRGPRRRDAPPNTRSCGLYSYGTFLAPPAAHEACREGACQAPSVPNRDALLRRRLGWRRGLRRHLEPPFLRRIEPCVGHGLDLVGGDRLQLADLVQHHVELARIGLRAFQPL